MYTAIYGLAYTLGASNVVPMGLTNLSMIISHVILGISISYMIVRLGNIEIIGRKK